ncbi:MAG: hypothetical protein HC771_03745 [Synechococcales cyanobacterium CRU_2_2]|nr:hypothetical protein [Synechococcales cyanobacterium CRU_2_2]
MREASRVRQASLKDTTPSLICGLVGVGIALGSGLILSPEAWATAGLRSPISGNPLDRITVPQQRVVSDRGADFLSPLGLQTSFRSDTTPPAPGRSVRLQNITPGFSGSEIPFTERDYSNPTGAEAFVLVPDAEHQTRWFSILPGSEAAPQKNVFRYTIFDAQGTVLESNEFSVVIALNPVPLTTTFRYGPDALDHRYGSLGYGYPRGHYGQIWNERRLFKHRQNLLFQSSETYRRRVRR